MNVDNFLFVLVVLEEMMIHVSSPSGLASVADVCFSAAVLAMIA